MHRSLRMFGIYQVETCACEAQCRLFAHSFNSSITAAKLPISTLGDPSNARTKRAEGRGATRTPGQCFRVKSVSILTKDKGDR